MKRKTQRWMALLALPCFVGAVPAYSQDDAGQADTAESKPADDAAPTLDELLGLEEEKAADTPKSEGEDNEADKTPAPELSRDLEKRLTAQEASDQFAQAIDEMAEVAIRLGDQADPGIDTQRMQDEIILKLEQIIASAEPKASSQPPKQGQPNDGEAREADRGGQPQPGQQQGDKPGDKPGQQPGQQANGDQPGQQGQEQQGEGQQPSDQQANGQEGGESAQQGSVHNTELSMKDLREGEWGNLPPRLRDELAESLSETFNPVYRAATEAFYRRIAELSEQEAEASE